MNITDEQLNYMAEYYLSNKDLKKRASFEQFLAHPTWYGYEVPVEDIPELDFCF